MSIGEIAPAAEILVLVLAFFVLPLVSALAGQRLARVTPISFLPRYFQAIARGGLFAAILLGFWLWARRPFSELGLDIPVGMLGRVGFVLDGLLLLFYIRTQARLRFLTEADFESLGTRIENLRIAPRTTAELAVFILVAITAGVWEELVYRGFALWYLSPRVGLVGALTLSSVAFGAGHLYQGWRGFVLTTLLGLSFGLLYIGSSSLWWLMAAHALIDIQAGLASYRVMRRLRKIRARAAPLVLKVN